MRGRLFVIPLVLFELASSSGLAQVDRPLIKNNPDAPLPITEAHCGQSEPSTSSLLQGPHYYCHATLQFADTNETWDGYGLLWTVTYQDGSKHPLCHAAAEATGQPDGSSRPSGRFFKPREIVDAEKWSL